MTTTQCKFCQTTLEQPAGAGRRRKFCSERCRSSYRRAGHGRSPECCMFIPATQLDCGHPATLWVEDAPMCDHHALMWLAALDPGETLPVARLVPDDD